MNPGVVRVKTEDKCIVYTIAPKDLHSESSREQYEANHWREIVRVDWWEYHFPVTFSRGRGAHTEKNKETCNPKQPTSEEVDFIGVTDSHLVVQRI